MGSWLPRGSMHGAPCMAPSLSLGLSLPCLSTGWGLGQGFAVPLPPLGSAPCPAWPGPPLSVQVCLVREEPWPLSHLPSLPLVVCLSLLAPTPPYPQPGMTSAALNPPVDLSLLLFPQQRGQCLDSVG